MSRTTINCGEMHEENADANDSARAECSTRAFARVWSEVPIN